MPEFYISVGSNIEPEKNLAAGLRLLLKKTEIVRISTHYRSAPAGGPKQQDYINGIWHGRWKHSPRALKALLKSVEKQCGRKPSAEAYAPRPLDLDLILMNDKQISSSTLHLPDPDIRERAFIFLPLLELEPHIRLPGDSAELASLVNPRKNSTTRQSARFCILYSMNTKGENNEH